MRKRKSNIQPDLARDICWHSRYQLVIEEELGVLPVSGAGKKDLVAQMATVRKFWREKVMESHQKTCNNHQA
jgi:hypothetical protein